MALLILPVTIFCLAVAVIIWTVITVLRHGFTLKATNHTTGLYYTKATRVLMWWLFFCSSTFLAAVATNSMKFFGLTILTFMLGGFASGWYINRTSAWSHEEMQSCVSLRITSVAALIVGTWSAFAPIVLIIFDAPGTDYQYNAIVWAIPVGVWLIRESKRIWKKANEKTENNRIEMSYQFPAQCYSSHHPNESREWWIARVMKRSGTRR